jgi:hypothetical protein
MNDEQYRWLCENRRFGRIRGLDEQSSWRQRGPRAAARSPLGAIVARAARQFRQRESARAAWQRIAPPHWQLDATVAGVDDQPGGGCRVVIATGSPAVCYELRRGKAQITRRFAQLVPGVRDVAFVVTGSVAEEA